MEDRSLMDYNKNHMFEECSGSFRCWHTVQLGTCALAEWALGMTQFTKTYILIVVKGFDL